MFYICGTVTGKCFKYCSLLLGLTEENYNRVPSSSMRTTKVIFTLQQEEQIVRIIMLN